MSIKLAAAILVLAGMPAFAHRLDEYLQGTIISIEKNRLQAQMTLTPGVAVFPFLIAYIDTDRDGVISETEQHAYAGLVLHDLSLRIDGYRLTPRLLSVRFPAMDDMKEGRGEIQLEFNATLPRGRSNRKITFENHHLIKISAYQVNCLVPHDPGIQIAAQDRNYSQSLFQLQYVQTDVRSGPVSLAWWPSPPGWLGTIALLLLTRLVFLWRQRSCPGGSGMRCN